MSFIVRTAAVLLILNTTTWALAEDKQVSEHSIWDWKLGLEERLRAEYRRDFYFNENIKDNGTWFSNRLKVNVAAKLSDEYLKEKMIIFVEGLDADVGSHHIKAQITQQDAFDFHQGYAQFFDILDSGVDLKGGRMEAKFGNGRLIAQPSWSNRMRHFDGGIAGYHRGGWNVDALYLRDVKYDDNNFNRSLNSEFLSGVYGSYQEHKLSMLYELYFLPQFISTGSSDIERYTTGVRLQGYLPYQILWETEFPYQFGHNGTRDIEAYALNISLSRGWETAWKPKAYFEYNLATGDDSSIDSEANTFIPLYQSTHDQYGLLDFFRWQNMREIAMKVDVSPFAKWKFTPQANFFWLENKNDAWYNASGGVIRNKTTGERGSFVGTELSLRAYYEFNKYVKVETGYAHFFTGDYIEDSGAHDDTDWVYSQLTFKY